MERELYTPKYVIDKNEFSDSCTPILDTLQFGEIICADALFCVKEVHNHITILAGLSKEQQYNPNFMLDVIYYIYNQWSHKEMAPTK